MEEKRSSFSGKIGFVLAAAGSAVGLGNIWRFPYLAAKYGGGIFLLVYIALAVTFGFSLMVAEIAIGRKTKLSPIGAFRALNKKFSFIGVLAAVVPAIILPYYSVIGGWVMKYIAGFVTGQGSAMANDSYFGNYIGSSVEPIVWFALFMAITAIIVIFGVNKGVEKVSKVMMPILVVFVIFIAIYSMIAVDGAWEGVIYYIKPDFSKFSIMTVVAAMGQLFYSMSLAMGIMITFGSYMKKDISIEKSTHQIEIFDSGIAFLSGLMIIPAVFAFGGEEALSASGPSLMFVTLPKIFDIMPGGAFIGAMFFIMVFFAALTSSISLMETVVSTVLDKVNINRRLCCIFVFLFCMVLGTVSSLGYSAWSGVKILGMQLLDFFDFASNSVLMPIVALATCIFVGYFLKPQTLIDELELSAPFKQKKMFSIVIKYFAPVCILVILISSVLSAFGVIKI
ncbi:MAG: sodium-dependent transporter [Clostridia bacterium]|nr:sodium-dependent transporter [Clostridia bacterium]MBO5416057.1 sodium-dependent transporter [Clostridia bacterium]